ncbi:MAG: lysine--tRNA ligase [Clostridia bacterium]|nr:lysine--tRNA ligase [Clostridia bacterium]
MDNEQVEVRKAKLKKISEKVKAYPERYETTHKLSEVASLEDGTQNVSIAGRILAKRGHGKMAFIVLSDIEGKAQASMKYDLLGEEKFNFFMDNIDIGDFIGVTGEVFTTHTGEKTVRAADYTFLGKCLRPLPEKWHGLVDIEACYRQRYLDLIMNDETKRRFLLRTKLVASIRSFLQGKGFLEVETPILQSKPSGALARPFITHHNALDIDVYLRIAPETYLKRLVVGGFTNVFEIGRCFRNEGISKNHLQDFTMIEGYSAYYNYKDNMKLMQEMFKYILNELFGTLTIKIGDKEIDFSKDWKELSFKDAILRDCGIDIDKHENEKTLLAEIKEKGIQLECDNVESLGKGNLIDQLYKKVSRPSIIEPTFLVAHPIDLSPLARANDDDPSLTDRFQLVVNGVEIVNAYSELVDPQEQRKRLEVQAASNAKGDEEAMVKDDDYILAMEYGMPPISGWGMGIDRLLQLLLEQDNIRDGVLFPLMRPLED